MKVLIFDSEAKAKQRCAERLLQQVQAKPDSVLGLATGGTMEAVYDTLVALSGASSTSWAQVATFNLDEYWGLPADSPASYQSYMHTRFFSRLDLADGAGLLPASEGASPDAAAAEYEAAIQAAGGIDLQLLGIGENGHIGFNEPTSSLGSRTRLKTLTEETRRANLRFFSHLDDVPRYALTMGIATILDARACMLLATGARKATAVKAMIEGPLSAACPASALQMHPNATVILDREAAQALELLAYYQHVHPGGEEPSIA
jgi:glucosamine-6-phosphate deaminase